MREFEKAEVESRQNACGCESNLCGPYSEQRACDTQPVLSRTVNWTWVRSAGIFARGLDLPRGSGRSRGFCFRKVHILRDPSSAAVFASSNACLRLGSILRHPIPYLIWLASQVNPQVHMRIVTLQRLLEPSGVRQSEMPIRQSAVMWRIR